MEKYQLVFAHLQRRRQLEFVTLRARLRLVEDRRALERDVQTYRAMRADRGPVR